MNPLIFNYNNYYINTCNKNYIYLNPKKKLFNKSNYFTITDITEDNIITCCIKENNTIFKQTNALLYEKKFCNTIFKFLIKRKTDLNAEWNIALYNQGLSLNFDIVNHSIIYTQFDKNIQLLDEIPLYFSNKLIKKILKLKLNKYKQLIGFFKEYLNYDDDIELLNYETLKIILNHMININKIKLLSILLDINLFTIYIKSNLQLKTIVVEKQEESKQNYIKVIWKDVTRCLF